MRDLVYGTGEVRAPRPGRKDLLLDLYRQRGLRDRTPAVVLLHGGAWKSGNRRMPHYMPDLCRELASRGWICASIEYRLLGDDPPGSEESALDRAILAAVEDAGKAVEWLTADGGRHGVDPRRIAVGGASAGAGTALFLAYGERGRGLPIRAALDFWGGMMSKTEWMKRGGPPILILHGTGDEITDFSVAETLAARARKVGVPHELVRVQGGRHNLPLAPHYGRIDAFLRQHLK